jgi:hypothetical protein
MSIRPPSREGVAKLGSVDFRVLLRRFLTLFWGIISTFRILSPKKESKIGQNNPENRRTLVLQLPLYSTRNFGDFMAVRAHQVSDFLLNNNLHLKPIGARIGMGVLDVSNWCKEGTDINTWEGKVAQVLSKGVLIAGGAATAAISTIECLAMTPISGIGLLFCFIT